MSIADLPTGLHRGIDHAAYHERVLGMASKGALELVARSPAHYRAWVDGVAIDDDTPALAFGAGFHCALLEPDCFVHTYCVAPEFGDCRKRENKNARDDWRASHAGTNAISAEDWDAMMGMAEAVRKHPLAGGMIRDGEAELTARWTDAETGLSCKCRGDYYVERLAMVADVKTTLDASPDAFRRDCAKYGYHHQDAFYRGGFAAAGAPVRYFAFIAVEKRPPYAVAVYSLDDAAVASGHAHVRRTIGTLAECLRTNTWPGYPASIETLSLPAWAA